MSEGTPNHNPDFPMQSMSVRLSDVWVVTVTYPKCGTTQTQKMVWQIVHKVKIDKEKKYLTLVRFTLLLLKCNRIKNLI